jgi:cell fate regulator YaaT (PSP1 superfamily)
LTEFHITAKRSILRTRISVNFGHPGKSRGHHQKEDGEEDRSQTLYCASHYGEIKMGCSNCSTGSNGLPNGCKNNGACGTYGCNKLDVFDWLAGMELPEGQKPFDTVEVRFKNNRKAFYRNSSGLELYNGDVIVVEVSPGYDVGVVSLTGELVRMQMRRKETKDNYEIKKILRKATESDIAKWQEGRKLEQNTMMRARTIARELNLEMKLSDVEYQGDKSKATFFYTADDRVDFRELIKRYAEEFRVRIDMRQIGYRYEAGRLGGIGSCGRELCCSTWLTDFRAVSTSAARYQQLSLNPAKLAGQCGKLKCCLNFELDQYVEATKEFPSVNTRLQLPKGTASHFKTDIFAGVMYFTYDGQPAESPFPLRIDAVKDIMERNKKGIAVDEIESYLTPELPEISTDFAEVVGQDSLTRFDKQRGRGPRDRDRGRGDRNRQDRRPQGGKPQGERPQGERPQGGRPQGGRPQEGRPAQEKSSGPKPQNEERQQRPARNERQAPRPQQGNRPEQGSKDQQRPPQGPREQRPSKPRNPNDPKPDGQQAQRSRPPQKDRGPRPPREDKGPKENPTPPQP